MLVASRTGAPISAVGLGEALPCRLRAVPCPGSCRSASLGRVHLPWHHCPELQASCCVGVPSAGDPPARAACTGSSRTAASAGSSALLPCSVCPITALGTAQGSIKVWLSCSCVLLWGWPLGWRDAAPLSSVRGWALAGRWVLSLPSAARTQMSGGGWRCAPSLVHASGRCRCVCGASSPGCGSAPWVTSAMALAGQPLATQSRTASPRFSGLFTGGVRLLTLLGGPRSHQGCRTPSPLLLPQHLRFPEAVLWAGFGARCCPGGICLAVARSLERPWELLLSQSEGGCRTFGSVSVAFTLSRGSCLCSAADLWLWLGDIQCLGAGAAGPVRGCGRCPTSQQGSFPRLLAGSSLVMRLLSGH